MGQFYLPLPQEDMKDKVPQSNGMVFFRTRALLPVVAPASGKVILPGSTANTGQTVIIEHSEEPGLKTLLGSIANPARLDPNGAAPELVKEPLLVKNGQSVVAGQILGVTTAEGGLAWGLSNSQGAPLDPLAWAQLHHDHGDLHEVSPGDLPSASALAKGGSTAPPKGGFFEGIHVSPGIIITVAALWILFRR